MTMTVTTEPEPPAVRPRFSLLWGAESVSLLGTQVTLIALPLTAVQLLGASGLAMGLLTAAGWLPVAALGLLAGVWVDRGNQARIMLAVNVIRLLLISTIPVGYAIGLLSMELLLVVALAAGVCAVFFDIAYQTYLPRTVPPKVLASANSRLELSRSVAQLAGPALAGFLVTALSAPSALLVDAASFAIAALLLVPLLRGYVPAPTDGSARLPVLPAIRAGIRFIRHNSMVSAVIAAASASNLFVSGVIALQVLLGVNVLGMSAAALGLAFAAEGAAALLGAAMTPRLTRTFGEGRLVLGSLGLMAGGAVALFLAPMTGAGVAVFVAGQICFGLSGPLINISLVTLRQRLTPADLLGRVNATARVAIMASLPIGSILFGALASTIGIRAALLTIAVGLILVATSAIRPMTRATGTACSC